MSEPQVTTYAEYLHPGAFVPETSKRAVSSRDAGQVAREAPASAYAFRFYDEVTGTIGDAPVRSAHLRESGLYFIDAERLTSADVEALPGDHSILLANMRGNGWPAVVRCRTGNFQPFRDGDVLVSSEGDLA